MSDSNLVLILLGSFVVISVLATVVDIWTEEDTNDE